LSSAVHNNSSGRIFGSEDDDVLPNPNIPIQVTFERLEQNVRTLHDHIHHMAHQAEGTPLFPVIDTLHILIDRVVRDLPTFRRIMANNPAPVREAAIYVYDTIMPLSNDLFALLERSRGGLVGMGAVIAGANEPRYPPFRYGTSTETLVNEDTYEPDFL